MKIRFAICALAIVLAAIYMAHAQPPPGNVAPTTTPYAFERGYPTAATTQQARDDADFQRAVTTYRFWYPTVSVEGIFNGNREKGIQDNQTISILAAGPRQVASCGPPECATLSDSNGADG